MEELTYHARIIQVNKDGSILVKPIVFDEKDYQDDMLLYTSNTKMYDRFGDRIDHTLFRKNQWIKFITGPKMTMSLPPQLNPTVIYEHIPMLEFKAKLLERNEKLSLKVIDNYGSFVEGKLKLNFFDKPIIFNEKNEQLSLGDLKVGDEFEVCAIVSFFTHMPLIEIYRAEKLS